MTERTATQAYNTKQYWAADAWINWNNSVWVSQVAQEEAPLAVHSFSWIGGTTSIMILELPN